MKKEDIFVVKDFGKDKARLAEKNQRILEEFQTGKEPKSRKIGRNEHCPCGSGKKYKKCCIEVRSNDSVTKILQLKITLEGIKPPVWRRFIVTDAIVFSELHEIIQHVMGWEDCHLYQFDVGETRIEGDDEGLFADSAWHMLAPTGVSRLASKTKLNELLIKEKGKFFYLYDFGDSWRHTVVIEKILEKSDCKQMPICVEGKRACPPEDSGGVYGYQELLEIRKDKNHPKYKELIEEWLGGYFDSEHFDAGEVSEVLKGLWNR